MNTNLYLQDEVKVTDKANIKSIQERMSAGPKYTRVRLVNSKTGESYGEYKNKLTICGSQFNAQNAFGIELPEVEFPTYNKEMGLDSTVGGVAKNKPIVCLFCISDSGCGSTPGDVKVSNYTDRIKPAPDAPSNKYEFSSDMIMPFRFVDIDKDINDDLRKYYFGKKTFTNLGKIGYYFKKFDSNPELHLRYADGTPIAPDMYNIHSNQLAECYVSTRLRITTLDFRDYFEQILGWDKARISSISLCTAWYDETIDEYVYYQDISPYTILYFSYIWLNDANVGIDVYYDIYF